MTTLSEISKELRKIRGWSQKKLADVIGTTQTEISFLERGFIPVDSEKVYRLKKEYENAKFREHLI